MIRFLNRLSDLLFVLARLENRRAGLPDVEWEGKPRLDLEGVRPLLNGA